MIVLDAKASSREGFVHRVRARLALVLKMKMIEVFECVQICWILKINLGYTRPRFRQVSSLNDTWDVDTAVWRLGSGAVDRRVTLLVGICNGPWQ